MPSFVAVEVAADPVESLTTASAPVGEGSAKRAVPARTSPAEPRERRSGVIEIELGAGRCVRVVRDVDADALRRVLDVLDGR